MTQALYFKPSYERLRDRITAIAPDLDVVVYDEAGRLWSGGQEVLATDIHPEWFWIHSELFFSPHLHDYFRLMLHSPSITWLHTINTGLDKLPYLELVERGVAVSNNHGQAIAIAEFVFGQLLAYYQNVYEYRARQQEKVWKHRGFREVQGSRWLLPEADVVVLACASNNETRDLVNGHFLARMKEKSVLINIARGDLVVEQDLRRALDAGRPEFAILDVFNHEPPAADSWVWTHPRVSLTPHTSNAGSGMRARSEATFLDNLARAVAGEPLQHQVRRRDIV